MRTKKIGNYEFKFYSRDEITYGAMQRVKRFLMTRVLAMMKGAGKEEEIFERMFENADKLAEYIQLVQEEEETNDIIAIMLVTNKDYDEIADLPISVIEALKEEVKTEAGGDIAGFLNGLGISISSYLETMFTEEKGKKKM
ncbi:hypothetical protein DRN97_03050 [Methanosarcinales archaeon]|nr:MAG: hypothetical protein DRN97_03050 [Methanosarcinales archaeon]